MDIRNAQPQSQAGVDQLNADQANNPMLRWKYIPNIDGIGSTLGSVLLSTAR